MKTVPFPSIIPKFEDADKNWTLDLTQGGILESANTIDIDVVGSPEHN